MNAPLPAEVLRGRNVTAAKGTENSFGAAERPQPGDFWLDPHTGTWYAMTPIGSLANLSAHDVRVHEDASISVFLDKADISVLPSILVTGGPPGSPTWHGYLERGVWREC